MQSRFTGLWRHPDFLKLWAGQTISSLGSYITRDGLPLIAVLTLAATPFDMGLFAVFASVPVLLLGLPAGAWVDRLPRRPILIAADLARLAVLLTIPLAALRGQLSLGLLYAVVAVMGVLSLIFELAYRAYLPGLVGRAHLLEGNSKLSVTELLAEIGGPALTGALVQTITAPLAIALDALTFLISAVSLGLIEAPEARADVPPEPSAGRSLRREIAAGWRVIGADPVLRAIAVGQAGRAFFGNFFGALYALYAIRDLGLSPAMLGIVISAGGISALAGALLAPWLTRRLGLGRALTWPLLVVGLVGLSTPLAGGPPWLAALILIAGQLSNDGPMVAYEINALSLRQMRVPDHLLGRANASLEILPQLVGPVGALLSGVLASVLGARLTLGIAVLGNLGTALWLAASPLRTATFEADGEALPAGD